MRSACPEGPTGPLAHPQRPSSTTTITLNTLPPRVIIEYSLAPTPARARRRPPDRRERPEPVKRDGERMVGRIAETAPLPILSRHRDSPKTISTEGSV